MLARIDRLARFESPSATDWWIYFFLFVVIQVPAILNFYDNTTGNNPYLLFAESLLNGDLFLTPSRKLMDLVYYEGQYYLPYPPLPSLILLPFVAIAGTAHVNTVAVATVMGCISLYKMYQILIRVSLAREYVNWMLLAAFFGTGYWFAIFTSHHVYAFAHITSFMFQLFVIDELLNRRRWWLVGVFIGCTFLCRQLTIFYVVLALGVMIHLQRSGRERISARDFAGFAVALGAFIVVYLVYNYLRFDNPFDTGYEHILYIGVLKERVMDFGVFSPRYFLFNFYTVFLKGFNIEFGGRHYLDITGMDIWGTSILAASPFVIASIKAQWPPVMKWSAFLTIGLILGVQLFYHNNGYHQINTYRFALDFLPLLIGLTALGARFVPRWLFIAMVVYSLVLNLVGFTVHYLYQ